MRWYREDRRRRARARRSRRRSHARRSAPRRAAAGAQYRRVKPLRRHLSLSRRGNWWCRDRSRPRDASRATPGPDPARRSGRDGCVAPTVAAATLRCPHRGRNSRLGAALCRSWHRDRSARFVEIVYQFREKPPFAHAHRGIARIAAIEQSRNLHAELAGFVAHLVDQRAECPDIMNRLRLLRDLASLELARQELDRHAGLRWRRRVDPAKRQQVLGTRDRITQRLVSLVRPRRRLQGKALLCIALARETIGMNRTLQVAIRTFEHRFVDPEAHGKAEKLEVVAREVDQSTSVPSQKFRR